MRLTIKVGLAVLAIFYMAQATYYSFKGRKLDEISATSDATQLIAIIIFMEVMQ